MLHKLSLLLLVVATFCSCYDHHDEPPINGGAMSGNCDISQLYQLCQGGCHTISSDIVCVGRVTSSDSKGNFYRSMFVEDSTAAVEILLGTYNIEAQYPVGVVVELHLKGCAVMIKEEILQVGLPPQSFDTAPREFESQVVIDRHIIRGSSVEDIKPLVCNIPSLDTSLCGRFVKVTDIWHAPLTDSDEESSMVEYHRFSNDNEDIVYTYISPYAEFASMPIPVEFVSVQGILFYESVKNEQSRQFVIRPRFKDDISTIDSTH